MDILALVAGLALFLLGMNSMGEGLENACGDKMKKILEKLTANKFIGVIVGMVITIVIQSSSATTVMVVGFVNAGMMTLSQAVWIIMGANIGTTITAQLIALDIGGIAPIFAIVGVIMIVFLKKPTVNEIGKIFCGFGILFIGMDMMSGAMSPLRDNETFKNLMTNFSNPIIGILVGAGFTAVIQSSSASVGILQALAESGAIELESAVFVLFGQNIGTCLTALLASMGTNRSAKRTTLIHFMFNIFGTILFTTICLLFPLTELIESVSKSPSQEIANMHTLFNLGTTLLLLPLGSMLVKIAEKILPEKAEKQESIFQYLCHDLNINVGGTAVHLENTRLEIQRMYDLAFNNMKESFEVILGKKEKTNAHIEETEDLIDKLNEGITRQITSSIAKETNIEASKRYSAYLNITHNIERISDHAMNILDYSNEFKENNIVLNEQVVNEIEKMRDICIEMMNIALTKYNYGLISHLEQQTDDMTKEFKENMMVRLTNSICTPEGSMIYSNVLIDFERLGDHLLNIAENIFKIYEE